MEDAKVDVFIFLPYSVGLWMTSIHQTLKICSRRKECVSWLVACGRRVRMSACIFKRQKESNTWKNMIFPTICNQCKVKVENKLRKGDQSSICIQCLMCSYYMSCMTESQATSEIFSIWMVSILEKDAKILEFIYVAFSKLHFSGLIDLDCCYCFQIWPPK